MSCALTTVKVKPERVDDFVSKYKQVADKTLSLAHSQGLESARLIVDRASGNTVTVGLWKTEEQARKWESNPSFGEAMAEMEDALLATPTREYFEVAATYDW